MKQTILSKTATRHYATHSRDSSSLSLSKYHFPEDAEDTLQMQPIATHFLVEVQRSPSPAKDTGVHFTRKRILASAHQSGDHLKLAISA